MATTPDAAFETLMSGVTHWDLPDEPVPSELLLTGEAAFPVMVNDKGQVLIAASFYGQGRLVVVSHEGYLMHAGMAPFLLNAVSWLCPFPGAPTAVHSSLASLANILGDSGIEALVQPEPGETLGVYCIDAYNDTLTEKLVQFVKHGGGLLIGGQAWYWASQHGRDKVLFSFPGNQVTSVAGVYFTDIYGDKDRFKISKKVPKIPLYIRCWEELRHDQEQLLHGISELDIKTEGVPSQLLVHGSLAFSLGLAPSYLSCFLAAARYGRGRVVLAAHENLLCDAKMEPFLVNAIHWLARDQRDNIGVNKSLKTLHSLLLEHGLKCSLESHLTNNMRVYCCMAYSDQDAKKIQEFVAEGGGLLIGGQSWWWASQNPGRSALGSFPGNVILNTFGLSILPRTLSTGCFPVLLEDIREYHFRKALSKFQAMLNHKGGNLVKKYLARLGVDVSGFLQIPAQGIPAYKSVHRVLRKMLQEAGLPAVSKKNPVSSDSCEAAMLHIATELAHSGTDCSEIVHSLGTQTGSSSPCPSEHLITVEINGSNPGDNNAWMSTGLYLLEGQSAEISVSEHAVSAGLKVQIGCHTDDLSEARKLFRAPVVTYQCCMDRTQRSVCCLWGGLLYIIVPKGCQLGPISVTIRKAVPAPYYKLGKTSLEEWKRCIQENPGLWGELATDNIILTVPTASLKDLEDPEPLLQLWDKMMQAVAKLAAKPFPFQRPERIVADVQISAGWMHSGYPIMCLLESVQELINLTSIKSNGLWGPIHELGHNQQCWNWEFPPHTTEATCNLWSVYVHETVLGIPRAQAHPDLNPEEREKRIKEHLQKGAPLSNWDVWTALETYLQVLSTISWRW
ncbi:TRPM8 channel-associated factor 2-like [Acomys russatus]|uniref:TRPM8 channel-associated factor 2-like n=1 Tax=Acomys russatus TaxID=60746 RepID=UPI0021E346ED|nr:TRPM8 channel-associated factor 2-like [Acomys russatus]